MQLTTTWASRVWVWRIPLVQGGFCCRWRVWTFPHRPIQWVLYLTAISGLALVRPGAGVVPIGAWGNLLPRPQWCSRSVVLMPWWRPLQHYVDVGVVLLVRVLNIVVWDFSCSQSIRCQEYGILYWCRLLWLCWGGLCTLTEYCCQSCFSMG